MGKSLFAQARLRLRLRPGQLASLKPADAAFPLQKSIRTYSIFKDTPKPLIQLVLCLESDSPDHHDLVEGLLSMLQAKPAACTTDQKG